MPNSYKQLGSLWGLLIGDALAMPAHWYYNREALRRDYGEIRDYMRPRYPHPDSILWRSAYDPINSQADILHDQAQYWGQRGVHYHQFLKAGENTLTAQLALELIASLVDRGGYDAADYTSRYIAFMTEPGRHRDTYVEECHRGFFTNCARGNRPSQCAVQEKHIGGLAGAIPVAAWYADRPDRATACATQHVAFTHAGPLMEEATRLVAQLLVEVLSGRPLFDTLQDAMARQDSPFLGHPFTRWLSMPSDQVIGNVLSPACYVQDALPATLYLALKYHDQPEQGLMENTRLGGDNVHRGAVLGALLGAEHGPEGFPQRWRDGLQYGARLQNWPMPMARESMQHG